MSDNLPSNPSNQNLAQYMNINPQEDAFEIRGAAGFVYGVVKKPNGQVTTIRATTDNTFRNMTHYDPSTSVKRRREIEASLYSQGFTQSEIADMVGIKQSTVSHDLRLLKNNKKGE